MSSETRSGVPPLEGTASPRSRHPGLRMKLNLAVLPILVVAFGGMMWLDYRHEVDAVMAAHELHAGPVSEGPFTGPVSPLTSPEAVARRALQTHLVYGMVMFVLVALAVHTAVSRLIIRPLSRVRDGIRQMQHGHWRLGQAMSGPDEMGQLQRDFEHLGLAVDALAAHLLHTERLAAVALLSRRLESALTPQVGRIARAVAALQASGLPAGTDETLAELADAAVRVAATVQTLDEPFGGRHGTLTSHG